MQRLRSSSRTQKQTQWSEAVVSRHSELNIQKDDQQKPECLPVSSHQTAGSSNVHKPSNKPRLNLGWTGTKIIKHILIRDFHCWWTLMSTVGVMFVMALTIRSLRWFMSRLFTWYTTAFKCPHRQKSRHVSGDLGGRSTGLNWDQMHDQTNNYFQINCHEIWIKAGLHLRLNWS